MPPAALSRDVVYWGGVMKDPDPKTWTEAARSYNRLRRLGMRFALVYAGSFVVFVVLFGAAAQARSLSVPPLIFLVFLLVSCPCGVGSFVTSHDLRAFRCPRCGGRFTGSRRGWPTNQCKHCRLDLGPAAMGAKKPSPTADSWE